MPADLVGGSHGLDELLRKILRMTGHKTDPSDSRHRLHLPQQLGEGDLPGKASAVRIDILPQQHDLRHAVLRQLPDLRDDLLRAAAALPASDVRHNAVAAEIVAAKHDIHAGLESVLPLHRKILHNPVRLLPDIHHHLLVEGAGQQLRELVNIVGSEDKVHKAVALLYLLHFLRFLHHTAAEGDLHPGMIPLPDWACPSLPYTLLLAFSRTVQVL